MPSDNTQFGGTFIEECAALIHITDMEESTASKTLVGKNFLKLELIT